MIIGRFVMPHRLVPSDRVETARVYGRNGEKIGSIERLMLEKVTGTVAYAVVRSGGLLETHHYPLPWNALKYDAARHAYETNLTLEELRGGPSELDGEAFDWGDRSRPYRHPQYWTV
jgi:PRC-barrel domain